MLAALFTRFRQFRQRRRQQRRFERVDQIDQVALSHQAPADPSRVLLLRNDSIGDYLLFRPWLRLLAAEVRGRGQHLTLAANALWAPLARAWDADCFDELLVVEFARFQIDTVYRTEVLRDIGAAGYGGLIYPLHVREPAVENFFRYLAAPGRVGGQGEHRTDAWFQLIDREGYTQLLPTSQEVLFEYDRNGEFYRNWLAAIGHAADAAGARPPLHIPVQEADAARFRAADGRAAIVLFPGASARQKRWPTGHFARLAQALHQRYGGQYRLVLAGSAADAEHAQDIRKVAGAAVPLENLCGQTNLVELAALLSQASLLISNDTVAAHLAVQLGTPCLVVLMGENYGKFFPYPPDLHSAPCRCLFPPGMEARFAQGNFAPPGRDPDIASITPVRVLAAAAELLASL
ncbi:MAG TPA: glycosyltransferase family 9 protein [Hymenobacter sp.]|uniref:glycosyltransferase family 9 protein n=1 Tax=Hymenobacter sp. TaxID=1898978 RepID=UPI002D7E2FD4|nr:glycosyltransferase family 9 protein [Hymenobacter sp.]HET9504477.1 glycosyltransferase family 9 protein [Hymenobacter sp.]